MSIANTTHAAPALTPVKSSNIEAVGYEPGTRTLIVKFKNGGTYHYSECLPEHYEGLIGAESPGGFLHKNIKGKFKHSKSGIG